MGARVSTPTSTSENNQLVNELSPFSDKCEDDSWPAWLGISDAGMEDVWVNINTEEPIGYKNFKSPYPFGGIQYNCAVLAVNTGWADSSCTDNNCVACTLPSYHFLYLRGICLDKEHQNRFGLEGYSGGRPMFRGYYDKVILWDSTEKRWILKDTSMNSTLAWMSSTSLEDYPLGKTNWVTTENNLCGHHTGSNISLSLSTCSSDQFMCLSGFCIAHQHRCNLRYECDDGSDEDDCAAVVLGQGYRSHLPPVGHRGSKIKVIPTFTLQRFANIDDFNMLITIEFHAMMRWRDGGLAFKHINSSGVGVILDMDDMNKIWKPQHQLVNLEGGQAQLLDTTVEVTTANNATKPHFTSIGMGKFLFNETCQSESKMD